MQRINQVIDESLQQTFTQKPAKASHSTSKTMNPSRDQAPMSSSSGNQEEYDKRMDTLFSRFAAIYGHVWISSYPTEVSLKFAKCEWSDALTRFDNQVMKQALIDIREHNKFPPTLPEFIACCKEKLARRKITTVDKKEIQPTDPKVARKHLKAMLADLTRKS